MTRRRALLWTLALLGAGVVFALGVALGEALHDNPKPGITVTLDSTTRP
ncbi:MAG TPA: hypothetical protein VE261_08205 [Gaiellaceae bacterium]|jgi:hypothetical protein|nr:hypothetical protein [Gaiellaceae bacterium]